MTTPQTDGAAPPVDAAPKKVPADQYWHLSALWERAERVSLQAQIAIQAAEQERAKVHAFLKDTLGLDPRANYTLNDETCEVTPQG